MRRGLVLRDALLRNAPQHEEIVLCLRAGMFTLAPSRESDALGPRWRGDERIDLHIFSR
jgi:hypothetical protein